MTEYTQEEAVFRMNEMGKAGRPFLFIIDYLFDKIIIEPFPMAVQTVSYR